MRSAARLLPLLLLVGACSHDARPSSSSAAPAPPPAAAPDTASHPGLDHRPDVYGGFGSQRALLQALSDTAAKFAALEVDRVPTVIGGWGDTTRLLATREGFTLAWWHGRGDHWWHQVWGAVNGTVVMGDSTATSARVVMFSQWKYRDIALVELQRDGGCPVGYRIVEYSDAVRATVSPEFGNCARPSIHRREEALRLRFPASPGHAAAEYTYLGHGAIQRAGQPRPTLYPDSLYEWGLDERAAILNLWRLGQYAAGTDTTELHAWLATPAGAFVLSRTPTDPFASHQLRASLGDSVIMRIEEMNYTHLHTYVELGGRPVALVSVADGGNGCQEMYHVVSTVGRQVPVLTGEFGSCSGAEVRLDGMRMDMHFEGYYTFAVSQAENFVPPPNEGYRYRGGSKVERLY